jgi:hypothetical protein
MNTISRSCYQGVRLPFLTVLMLTVFGSDELNAREAASACDTVTKITGEYQCSGKCIITTDGKRELITVSGETDTVKHFAQPSEQQSVLFYQVDIKNGDFHEIELGSLVGPILRTATAEVSDNEFPVLEEYLFQTDSACHAQGYTKIVSNPSKENFKSCVVYCKKTD